MLPILDHLDQLYTAREEEIERWLGQKRAEAPPYLYNSVDLRHSGVRLAPVDTNLYPAGFNTLSAAAAVRASRFLHSSFAERFPGAKRLLIAPETHTRNQHYLENVAALKRILETAGMETQVGALSAEAPGEKLTQKNGLLLTERGFTPDVIVLNNDCTSGIPELLQNIAQPIVPPPEMGWWRRRKTVHFCAYRELATAFADTFKLDPWLIAAEFRRCGHIDFKAHVGLDRVAHAVDNVIAKARAKHRQYGIAEDPYVFVKADSGTYGMGIMAVHSGSEMIELNKKNRNKMQSIKEGAEVHEVIVQEGIPTIDRVAGKPAEQMIYLIDGIPTGGMYRVNGERDSTSNLNAAGVEFTGMCDETEAVFDCRQPVKNCQFRAFGLVAALAALAVPREHYEEKTHGHYRDDSNQAGCSA